MRGRRCGGVGSYDVESVSSADRSMLSVDRSVMVRGVDTLPVLSRPFVMQTDPVGDEFLLPAGTVTFLLTDVEGSSRLWEERPVDVPAAIARHYDLLDEAIAARGGVRPVEQGEGDSVVAAFARAGDALRAAVAAQRALTADLPWLRVRMAVHTGEAQLRDEGNYVGRRDRRAAYAPGCVVTASDASRQPRAEADALRRALVAAHGRPVQRTRRDGREGERRVRLASPRRHR